MPASSIAQILLRIFALQWIISALIYLFYTRILSGSGDVHWFTYAPSVAWLLAGFILWAAAPTISRLAAKGSPGGFTLEGVTERTLYAMVFLGLGLFFALKSFAAVFSWLHFHAMHRNTDFIHQLNDAPSFYSLSESLLTFGAGITLVLSCRILARKMTPKETPEPMDA